MDQGPDPSMLTLSVAEHLATCLIALGQFDEAKAFLLERIPEVERVCGNDDGILLRSQGMYAHCLCENDNASRDDLTEAIAMLEDLDRKMTRIYGNVHPHAEYNRRCIKHAREKLSLTLASSPV